MLFAKPLEILHRQAHIKIVRARRQDVLAAGNFAMNNTVGQVGTIASAGGSFRMFSGLETALKRVPLGGQYAVFARKQ